MRQTSKIAPRKAGVAARKKEGKGRSQRGKATAGTPAGWYYGASRKQDYEVGLEQGVGHSGTRCAYIRSIVQKPTPFGNLMQSISAETYIGKKVQYSAWVRTRLVSGTCQLWIRVDGDWKTYTDNKIFDNMSDRPIEGDTDWNQYKLVVEIPKTSSKIAFGCMLIGKGKVWFDDVSIGKVSNKVPVTGRKLNRKPSNLDFEADEVKPTPQKR